MLNEKVEATLKPLDDTVTTEVIKDVQSWINAQAILSSDLYLDYVEGTGGLGFCMKKETGQIIEEDILGSYSAEIVFYVYFKTNAVPDGSGMIYKPLNDLSDWFAVGNLASLDLGVRRSPRGIVTLKGPVDISGRDSDGNTTFYSTYKIIFYEEAN